MRGGGPAGRRGRVRPPWRVRRRLVARHLRRPGAVRPGHEPRADRGDGDQPVLPASGGDGRRRSRSGRAVRRPGVPRPGRWGGARRGRDRLPGSGHHPVSERLGIPVGELRGYGARAQTRSDQPGRRGGLPRLARRGTHQSAPPRPGGWSAPGRRLPPTAAGHRPRPGWAARGSRRTQPSPPPWPKPGRMCWS